MKKISNLFILFIFISFASCDKESPNKILIEADKSSGFISERGIDVPFPNGKCDCKYEILDFTPINHSDYRYWLKGQSKTADDGCPDCPNGLFEARYYCLDGYSPNCYNVHNDPIPDGLFDFNCRLNLHSEFSTSIEMACCQNDWTCMTSPDLVDGKIAYKIHCKLIDKVADENNSTGFSSSDCDDLLSSEIIKGYYNEATGGTGAKIALEGDCGCQPVVKE